MVDCEAKMNLAALRKVDSTISSIVDIANQVAVYKFLSEANKWVSLGFGLYCPIYIHFDLVHEKLSL